MSAAPGAAGAGSVAVWSPSVAPKARTPGLRLLWCREPHCLLCPCGASTSKTNKCLACRLDHRCVRAREAYLNKTLHACSVHGCTHRKWYLSCASGKCKRLTAVRKECTSCGYSGPTWCCIKPENRVVLCCDLLPEHKRVRAQCRDMPEQRTHGPRSWVRLSRSGISFCSLEAWSCLQRLQGSLFSVGPFELVSGSADKPGQRNEGPPPRYFLTDLDGVQLELGRNQRNRRCLQLSCHLSGALL